MAKCSVEYLHERFILNRNTGELFWKYYTGRSKKWNSRWAGKPAGSLSKQDGYIELQFDGEHYRAHVIVWAMVKGYWPENEIDHRNGVRNYNKPSNLREATPAQQRQNAAKRSDNTSGYVGVTWDRRRQSWIAQIHLGGKHYQIGQYDTPEQAYAAYRKAKKKLHLFEPKVRSA